MRKDTWDVTVAVDGVDLGTWDTLTGGEVDSEETTYKPGGMAPRISLGGSVNVGNVTVGRYFDIERDGSLVHWLMSRAGKGQIVIKKTPLDDDGNASNKPLTYTGKLKMVTPPEVDSEASDAATIELEMTPAGTVA